MKVAIDDCREYGGACALRGCIPKKVLTDVANIIDAHNRILGKGIVQEKHVIYLPSLIDFKKTFTDPHPLHLLNSFNYACQRSLFYPKPDG